MTNSPVGSSHKPFCCGREVLAVLQEHGQHEAEAELAHREHEPGEQPVAVGLATAGARTRTAGRVAPLLRPLDEVERGEDARARRANTSGMIETGRVAGHTTDAADR